MKGARKELEGARFFSEMEGAAFQPLTLSLCYIAVSFSSPGADMLIAKRKGREEELFVVFPLLFLPLLLLCCCCGFVQYLAAPFKGSRASEHHFGERGEREEREREKEREMAC